MKLESTISHTLPKHLILYDGECGLCDHIVQFLLEIDKKELLHYSPLQGDIAKEIIRLHPRLHELDSILYVKTSIEIHMNSKHKSHNPNINIYWHSAAVIEICKIFPFPYSMMRFLFLCPKIIRDWAYLFIARHRLRFFGTVDACKLPTPSERARFL